MSRPERAQCWGSTVAAAVPTIQDTTPPVGPDADSAASSAPIRVVSVLSRSLRSQLTRANLNETTQVVSSAVRSWRAAIFRRVVFIEAVDVLRLLLRNVLLCSGCAWGVTFLYSLGNPFALVDSNSQLIHTLTVSNLIWGDVIFCILMVFMHCSVLLPLRFLSDPNNPPTLWPCVKELTRATYHHFICSLIAATASGFLVGFALPATMRKYKLDFYLGVAANHIYMTGIDMATRRIYQTRTCQGQARLKKLPTATLSPARRRRLNLRLYWKGYLRGSTKLLQTSLAGAYVQIVSQTHLPHQGLAMVAFVAFSTAAKVLGQELIKHYVVKHQIKDARTMCVLVGLPTVLIDTQVRIVLLGQHSNTFAGAGILGMAAAEIALRGSKAVLLRLELRRRHGSILKQASTLQLLRKEPDTASLTAAVQRDFEQIQQLMHRYHAAEASADMHAEYIAIGCSASIWFFYSDHQHYDLGGVASTNSPSRPSTKLALFLLVQVAVEIVVDFVSCVLEIAAGVDFRSIRKHGSFLAFLFMTTAIINIEISVVLYMA